MAFGALVGVVIVKQKWFYCEQKGAAAHWRENAAAVECSEGKINIDFQFSFI